MVKLNDASPSAAQIAVNLFALGQVAAAAAADATAGTSTLSALIVSKAAAAIGTVSGFAPSDFANIGVATALTGASRVRVAVDLSVLLLLGEVKQQFGTDITPYASATGTAVLSRSDLPGLLANRIDAAAPGTPSVQELKEWMALLSYLDTSLGGSITSEYFSTANFLQFGSFGTAVQVRNASYPIASIGQLTATLVGLQNAP